MSQIYYLYKIWLSESSGPITWLVDGQMQWDQYLSSVTPFSIQIDQQKITITEVMLVILKIITIIIAITIFRMIVVTDNIKNNNNGSNSNSNSSNKYQTIQEKTMVQEATKRAIAIARGYTRHNKNTHVVCRTSKTLQCMFPICSWLFHFPQWKSTVNVILQNFYLRLFAFIFSARLFLLIFTKCTWLLLLLSVIVFS